MANQFQNSSLIAKEFLVRLKNTFTFTMSINRQHSNLFQGKGTKPGTTVDFVGRSTCLADAGRRSPQRGSRTTWCR